MQMAGSRPQKRSCSSTAGDSMSGSEPHSPEQGGAHPCAPQTLRLVAQPPTCSPPSAQAPRHSRRFDQACAPLLADPGNLTCTYGSKRDKSVTAAGCIPTANVQRKLNLKGHAPELHATFQGVLVAIYEALQLLRKVTEIRDLTSSAPFTRRTTAQSNV